MSCINNNEWMIDLNTNDYKTFQIVTRIQVMEYTVV